MKQYLYESIYTFFRYQRKKAMRDLGGIPNKLTLGSGSLFYWRFAFGNSKPPIIFLHGLLDESFGFRRIIKQLIDSDREVLVFDLPGYGSSRLPDFPYLYQIDVWADILLSALANLEIQSASLVGHSMGGLIAQHMALADQEKRLQKLVLIAPANAPHDRKEEMRKLLFPKTTAEIDRLMTFLYFKDPPNPPSWIKRVLVYIWNSKANAYLENNTLRRETEIFLGKRSKAIAIPTLVVAAENDQITTLESLKDLQKTIKKSKLSIVKEAKHAVHLEKPEEVANLIKTFI